MSLTGYNLRPQQDVRMKLPSELERRQRKRKRKDSDNHSPMESFALRAANMVHIWDQIVNYLDVKDLANCLKTSKSLRIAFGQCVASNSKLHHKMNLAATVTAVTSGKVQSKVQLQFKCAKVCTKVMLYDYFFAINGTWYHKHYQGGMHHVDLLKLGEKNNQLFFKKSLITDSNYSARIFSVLSTQDSRMAIVRFNNEENNQYMIGMDTASAFIAHTHTNQIKIASKYCNGFWEEVENEMDNHFKPYCARYRLYKEEGEQRIRLHLTLLNEGGYPRENKLLYDLKFVQNFPEVIHTTSNEEAKFLIVLPNLIAVHCATTGEVIWKKTLGKDENEGIEYEYYSPFLTKDIAGCFEAVEYDEEGDDRTLRLHIYDTKKGERINRLEFDDSYKYAFKEMSFARGSCLCYLFFEKLFVIQVLKKEVKQYEFAFPMQHIIEANNLCTDEEPWVWCIDRLIGFLGKSNVLLGMVRFNGSLTLLFSLNLDNFFAAKTVDEKNAAFSLPLLSFYSHGRLGFQYWNWKPVYQTDKARGCVDIVGVMGETRVESQITLEIFFCH